MTIPPQISIDDLCQIYLVANTPRYLFRHLREHHGVKWMSENFSIDELVAIYSDNQRTRKRSVEHVALAYAALIALYYKSYEKVEPILGTLATSGLRWAPDVIDILKKTAKVVSVNSIQFSPPTKSTVISVPGTAGLTEVNIETKPRIEIVRR
jgi:hypothetical protein